MIGVTVGLEPPQDPVGTDHSLAGRLFPRLHILLYIIVRTATEEEHVAHAFHNNKCLVALKPQIILAQQGSFTAFNDTGFQHSSAQHYKK